MKNLFLTLILFVLIPVKISYAANESAQEKAQHRLPPVIYSIDIPKTVKSGETYEFSWSVMGYHESYDIIINIKQNGSNNNLINKSVSPNNYSAGQYSWGEVQSTEFKYSTNVKLDFSGSSELIIRFFARPEDDTFDDETFLSCIVPGGLGYTAGDTTGRKIKIFGVDNSILLAAKPYSEIDKTDMYHRYVESLIYYNANKSKLDNDASALVNTVQFTGTIFDDNALSNLSWGFYLAGRPRASEALDNFLSGTGDNIEIDIQDTLDEGGAVQSTYAEIINQINDGKTSGVATVEQWEWGNDSFSIGVDEKYTYGTLRIQWETSGNYIVLYVDDIYSYDISDYSSGRPSIPLYKNANDLVLSQRASDFYFIGRTEKIHFNDFKAKYDSAAEANSGATQ